MAAGRHCPGGGVAARRYVVVGRRGSGSDSLIGDPVGRTIDGLEKRAFLSKDEALRLRPLKVPHPFLILLQTQTIGFIVSQRLETDHSPADVVGSFVRKKIADQVTTTAGNDAPPVFGVGFKLKLPGLMR